MSFFRKLSFLFMIILGVVLVIFSFTNRQAVPLYLNAFQPSDPNLTFTAPLFFWLLLTVAIGFIFGYFYATLLNRKYKKAFYAAQKQRKPLP